MKLRKFKVENFRSISDSGWIDSDYVTSLVGVNESGKSNLLLALWKLHPATGGEINKLEDMPRASYSEWRDREDQPIFITCQFELSNPILIKEIIELSGCTEDDIRIVEIKRDFAGTRTVGFPNFNIENNFNSHEIIQILNESKEEFRN